MTPSGSIYSHKYVGADIAGLVVGGGPSATLASSFSGLRYVRGSPIPGGHFRRYLANQTRKQGRAEWGATPAVPCHTDPGVNSCTPAGGRPVCRMEYAICHVVEMIIIRATTEGIT